jgi:biotin operon repressor
VAQITRATRTALAEAGIPLRRQLGVSRRSVERAVQTNY